MFARSLMAITAFGVLTIGCVATGCSNSGPDVPSPEKTTISEVVGGVDSTFTAGRCEETAASKASTSAGSTTYSWGELGPVDTTAPFWRAATAQVTVVSDGTMVQTGQIVCRHVDNAVVDIEYRFTQVLTTTGP
jgi:hypothetical protein